MSLKNKSVESFLIISIALGFLLVLSFFKPDVKFDGFTLKHYNLFSDVITKKKKSQPHIVSTTASVLSDTASSKAIVEAVAETKIIDFAKDTLGGLNHFIKSLIETKKNGKITRVAYFSDSMIEGDILTQDFRNNLQNYFGGKGVGFVPITSITAGFRQTIRHTFSPDWQTYSLIENPKPENTLGIAGFGFIPNTKKDSLSAKGATSWVAFNASPFFKNLDKLYTMKLYYGEGAEKNFLKYQFNGGKDEMKPLSGNNVVNELVLNDTIPVKTVAMSFFCESPIKIYGASFESKSGVFVDNFSFRGNSGLPLTKIPYNVLRNFNSYLQYDLIILHYGLNVANTNMKDYSWYQYGMVRVINYLKSCFPQASFLLVSVNDKSYKNEMEYETDPSIPILVDTQRQIAQNTGVAFWNLYENMGGYNSMISWVDTTAPLANKDYAHLNFRGGKKVADMLFKHIMDEYNSYERAGKIQ